MKTNSWLRLALISDIHYGPDVLTKKGSSALDLLDDFVHFCSQHQPDLVIDLGDRINNESQETDLQRHKEVAAHFKIIEVPRQHLVGNHDCVHVSREEQQSILGTPTYSTSMDLQGWHLVFWQAETGNYWPDGCEVSDADLEWLRADLSAASLPCIVCSHLPLGPCAMHGNYYFQNNPRFARYGRDKEIRAVLESSAKVVLCLAGHTHWNRYQVHSNITYVSLQSLTESFTTFPDPAGARAWMELESDRGCLRVYGRDWLEIVFPLQCESRPWVKPLKSFDRRAKEPSLQNEAKLRALGAVLFDLDGVFYQGEHPLPGGAWLLSLLRRMGLPFMALTNNARKPPSFYSQRLAAMGVDFPARLILTSAEVAAAYLAQEETGSVFVIGSPWLEECVQRQGLKIDARDVEVVLAGMEENLTLEDLAWACLQVRSGARLVVTNPDRSLPTPEGRIPSAGALQAYLETASGYKAQIIGKPARFMFEQAVKTLGVDPRATLMVGDTWDTDILGAKQAGLQTAFLGDLSEGAKDVELAAPDLKCLTELLLQKGVLG